MKIKLDRTIKFNWRRQLIKQLVNFPLPEHTVNKVGDRQVHPTRLNSSLNLPVGLTFDWNHLQGESGDHRYTGFSGTVSVLKRMSRKRCQRSPEMPIFPGCPKFLPNLHRKN
jgi:hypothetical protein